MKSHLGDDFPLRKVRERLKCQICSSRKVTITFLGPHQKGGNLKSLVPHRLTRELVVIAVSTMSAAASLVAEAFHLYCLAWKVKSAGNGRPLE